MDWWFKWSQIGKVRIICIHDFIFSGLTLLPIISAAFSHDLTNALIFVSHFLVVNISRSIIAFLLMKSNYSLLWAKRLLWTRIATINFQIIIDIAYIVLTGVSIGSRGKPVQIPGYVIICIIIIIVIGWDFYYMAVVRSYILTPRNEIPHISNSVNPVQMPYILNSPGQITNNIAYIQGDHLKKRYDQYQGEIQTGFPVRSICDNLHQNHAYPIIPLESQANKAQINTPE